MPTLLRPRVIAPGLYRGEIFDAAIIAFPWRVRPDNPAGLCLRTFVEVEAGGDPAHLNDCCDISHVDRIETLFNAAGLEFAPDWQSRIGDLVGREVYLAAKNICPRAGRGAGREKAVVSSWCPTPKRS